MGGENEAGMRMEQKLTWMRVPTRNQHGGHHFRGLQEIHVAPLEGLTVVCL